MNELPVIDRIFVFVQRFLGSPRGEHCKTLQRNVWRKVVSMSEKNHSEDYHLFRCCLSEIDLGNVDTREV